MRMTSNVHTHTTWCDGINTPKEMAQAALELGFSDLGFSAHSPIPLEREYPWMKDEEGYRKDIADLKKEYDGRLGILCGVEHDYFSKIDRTKYDYTIGSVHYLRLTDESSVTVDSPDWRTSAALKTFGTAQKMYREYYALMYEHARQNRPDIIGHFDLLKKYNSDNVLFDEDSEDYKNTALEALEGVLDIVVPYGGMIELNVSCFARNLRDVPYPSPFILKRIAQRSGRIIITTDAHRIGRLNDGFDTAIEFLKQAGFKSMAILRNKKFIDIGI